MYSVNLTKDEIVALLDHGPMGATDAAAEARASARKKMRAVMTTAEQDKVVRKLEGLLRPALGDTAAPAASVVIAECQNVMALLRAYEAESGDG